MRPKIVGVVNITTDSFSDGGLYLEPERAIAHARDLVSQGADIIELGAASSNPDAAHVGADEEIARLRPVLHELQPEGHILAVDTTKPEVQKFVLERGIAFLNDVRGFPDNAVHEQIARSSCRLVVMHSITGGHQARRLATNPQEIYEAACRFFQSRLDQLSSAGIAVERIILDPGMGFFLGSNPETSLAMLAKLKSLRKQFGQPLFVSVSRKSFLRNLPPAGDCDIQSRTLAAELYAAAQGVEYIRTHDARALSQALSTTAAIARADSLVSL